MMFQSHIESSINRKKNSNFTRFHKNNNHQADGCYAGIYDDSLLNADELIDLPLDELIDLRLNGSFNDECYLEDYLIDYGVGIYDSSSEEDLDLINKQLELIRISQKGVR